MKRIDKEIIVPESKKVQPIWVADDGTKFTSEEGCRSYEHKCAVEKNPVWKTRITNVRGYYGEGRYTMFKIGSQEDYDLMLEAVEAKKVSGDSDTYKRYGRDWYMHRWYNDGSPTGCDIIHAFNKYRGDARRSYSKWTRNVLDAISVAEKNQEKSKNKGKK